MNCYSNLTLERLQSCHAAIYAEPARKWLKVGPNAGLPPAWAEAVLMVQAIGEKVNQPLTFAQAKEKVRENARKHAQ
jgi:hypothetical protein